MSARFHILFALWLGLFAMKPSHGQQLLLDINTRLQGPEVRELATIGTKVFIGGRDGSLWVTDQAVTAVRRLEALDPPVSRGLMQTRGLFALGDRVLLRVEAEGRVHRVHLWVSDGTEAGTRPLLEDPVVSINNSGVEFARAGKWAYFYAAQESSPSAPGSEGSFIWRTDGTPEGTRPVLRVGPESSRLPLVGTRDRVFFSDYAPVDRRGSVFALDVSTDQVVDLFPEEDLDSEMLGATGDFALFSRWHPTSGWEPWISDGTRAGTRLLADLHPGPGNSSPDFAGTVRNRLVFKAAGWLWSTDGSTSEPEALLETDAWVNGRDLDNPSGVSTGSLLFFAVNEALWVTDGTQTGTRMVHAQPRTDHMTPTPWSFVPFGTSVFFQWEDPIHGLELWTSDGTAAGTRRMTELRAGPVGVNRLILAPTHSGVLVAPWPSGPLAPILFHGGVDGTLREARFVFGEQEAPGSDPGHFVDLEDGFLFTATRGGHGREVWYSDGTRDGTRLFSVPDAEMPQPEYELTGRVDRGVLALNTGRLGLLDPQTGVFSEATSVDEGPVEVFAHATGGDTALLVARSVQSTPEFWLSDGTPQGTAQITHFDYDRLNIRSNPLGRLGDRFLFVLEQDNLSRLYAVDLFSRKVHELMVGWDTSARRVTWLHTAGGKAVLASEDGLVETDGTMEGTHRWAFDFRGMIRQHARLGDIALFAPQGTHTGEIWRTDGTESGTRLVEDLCPPPQGCDWVEDMFTAGDRVFFVHPYQGLWMSDGTANGTVWLTLQPSNADAYDLLARTDNQLIFEVRQGYSSQSSIRSLWAVDVTERRFRRLIESDLWVAAGLEDIRDGRIIGNRLVFTASTVRTGRELFFVDLENPRGVAVASTPPVAEGHSLSAPYPNPFPDRTRVVLLLSEPSPVRAEIFDLTGRRVASVVDTFLPTGRHELDIELSNLPASVYLLRVRTSVGRLQQRLVKVD